MGCERGNTILFILALACVAAIGVIMVVFGPALGAEEQRVNLPPEGEALVMVWRDQAVPEAHVAVRRGGSYYLPGPQGDLVEDTPPSYWEDLR